MVKMILRMRPTILYIVYMLRNKTSDSKPVFIEQWNFQNETVTSTGIGKTSFMDSDYKWNNYLMDVTATYQNKVSKLDYSIMAGASQELVQDNKTRFD